MKIGQRPKQATIDGRAVVVTKAGSAPDGHEAASADVWLHPPDGGAIAHHAEGAWWSKDPDLDLVGYDRQDGADLGAQEEQRHQGHYRDERHYQRILDESLALVRHPFSR